jgi:excisionase family DNA binding protein
VSDLLTRKEVAAALRVSLRTVAKLIATGQLRVVKIGTRTLVTDRELAAYVAAHQRRVA